ncbi:MAG: hypothetical protein BRD50_04570 [Bacteroidetes bacterium SW_11_45_7]|nr:MAG: hypothetical protein BRD50_04570 [Bacteroidetes bacterium SW_11_45_7]
MAQKKINAKILQVISGKNRAIAEGCGGHFGTEVVLLAARKPTQVPIIYRSEEVILISRSVKSLYLPTCRENQPLSKASCFCIVKHWGSLPLSFYLEIFLMKGKGLS